MRALQLSRRGRRDLHARSDGPGDGDQLRDLMIDQRAAGVAISADDVENTRRQELVAQFGQQDRRCRGRVARLQHDGVPRSEGGRDLPDRHHQRVVPRRHLTHDPDRLAPDPGRVPGQVLPGRPPLQHPRGPGEEAQLVHAGRQFLARGQRERLPGVLALHPGELVRPRLQRVRDLQQHPLPVRRCRVPPGLEGSGRSPHRLVDILRPGLRRLRIDLTGRRVDHVVRRTAERAGRLAVHKIRERLHAREPNRSHNEFGRPSGDPQRIHAPKTRSPST